MPLHLQRVLYHVVPFVVANASARISMAFSFSSIEMVRGGAMRNTPPMWGKRTMFMDNPRSMHLSEMALMSAESQNTLLVIFLGRLTRPIAVAFGFLERSNP